MFSGLTTPRKALGLTTPFSKDRPYLDAGEEGRGAGLVVEDVGVLVEYHFVTTLGRDVHGDLIHHRPRRTVKGRLLAEKCCHVLLQPVNRRVLPKTSSTTTASAIARRIAFVGRVTVSL